MGSYRLHMAPLSPVPIGTGESCEPTRYVIGDKVPHGFDAGRWPASLHQLLIRIEAVSQLVQEKLRDPLLQPIARATRMGAGNEAHVAAALGDFQVDKGR
jgi:hypothetical protein